MDEQNIKLMRDYVSRCLEGGFSKDLIKKALLQKNWPESMIDGVLSESFSNVAETNSDYKSILYDKDRLFEAKYFLRNVNKEKSFWVNNGNVLQSLTDLSEDLLNMDDRQFRYHLNMGKNDFAVWVSTIIGDKELAKRLYAVDSREDCIQVVQDRVEELKSRLLKD